MPKYGIKLISKLGKQTDASIAREFGFSREWIRIVRVLEGVPRYKMPPKKYYCLTCGKGISTDRKFCDKGCDTCHRMNETRIYRSWQAMKQRCANPNSPMYIYYGARGITVCDRWMKFENFHEDMGDMPDGLTIDRIDNDGNYEPSNCKWSTYKEQMANRRPRGTVVPLSRYNLKGLPAKKVAIAQHLINSNGWTLTKASRYLGIHWNTARRYRDIYEQTN